MRKHLLIICSTIVACTIALGLWQLYLGRILAQGFVETLERTVGKTDEMSLADRIDSSYSNILGGLRALDPAEQEAQKQKEEQEAISEQDYQYSESYGDSAQFCTDCKAWLQNNLEAQKEFVACKRHWFYSSDMQQVCTFEMPVELPSGAIQNLVCPGWENEHCKGPMTLDSEPKAKGLFIPYLNKENCLRLNWGDRPNYAAMSKFESLSSRSYESLSEEEKKLLEQLKTCQKLTD